MVASASRILRSFFAASPEPAHDSPEAELPVHPLQRDSAPLSPIDRANARLIENIGEFLMSCRLGVTARNLMLAHAAFSGDDPQLARAIAQRRQSDQPITQQWLDEMGHDQSQEDAIKALVATLEDSIDHFAATAHQARTSSADCHAELARHVDAAQGNGLEAVLTLAQTVLDHSQRLEAAMQASEDEARGLRERLARAQRDAEVDHLTGLPNRRAFEAVLDREYREAQAEIEHLSVAFCDIDHFKRVNDNHGHETGDRVLQAVAETLDRLSNRTCHVARHGGEEFVLLFRGLTKAQARDKLDAVREQLADRRFVNRKTDDPIGRITFSGGVADVFAYPTPRDALRAADEALYLAKEQGRNIVMSAP
jgi:diguanylate cyclase